MTQEEFDKLPVLLTSAQVCAITGLDRHELATEVKLGNIRVFKRHYLRPGCKSARPRYTKASVAALAGFSI